MASEYNQDQRLTHLINIMIEVKEMMKKDLKMALGSDTYFNNSNVLFFSFSGFYVSFLFIYLSSIFSGGG